jgi:hypothetical protein
MNKQEIFDAVAIGIRAQGGPAINSTGNICAYRASNGRKCAAGLLMKDEDYDPGFEGGSVSHLPEKAFPGFSLDDMYLISQLQHAHDTAAMASDDEFFAVWRQKMIEVAERNEVSQLSLLISVESGENLLRIRAMQAQNAADAVVGNATDAEVVQA